MRGCLLLWLALAGLIWVGPSSADAPGTSLRPEQRPVAQAETADAQAPVLSLRPAVRPGEREAPTELAAAGQDTPFGTLFSPLAPRVQRVIGGTDLAVARSLRPDLRPEALERRVRAEATRQTPSRIAQLTQRGQLCGRPGLFGDELQTITGRISGCGIARPIRLREVDGVRLTQPATINCDAAEALQTWVREAAQPAVGRRGGGITSIRVVASYACRTRNSRPGARLSEHALGNAIDIAAVGLNNGTEISVLEGWRDRRDGPILRAMHRGACGTFGTVLGPESDRFHQDHFHFDVAAYRSGAYCR